jgi:tetratricopeptide (TPR) repeat protein
VSHARDSALETLRHVLQHDEPHHTELLTSRDVTAAVAFLAEVLEADSDDLAARHALGWWHHLMDRLHGGAGRADNDESESGHALTAWHLLLPVYQISPNAVPPAVADAFQRARSSYADLAVDQLSRCVTGDLGADLDQAVELSSATLSLTPLRHPARAGYLSNLGLAYRLRFEYTGAVADLDQAIQIGEAVVQASSEDHHRLAGRLSNLGIAYRLRFERTDNLVDLDRAITTGQAAVHASAEDHPDRAGYLSNLGEAYRITEEHTS